MAGAELSGAYFPISTEYSEVHGQASQVIHRAAAGQPCACDGPPWSPKQQLEERPGETQLKDCAFGSQGRCSSPARSLFSFPSPASHSPSHLGHILNHPPLSAASCIPLQPHSQDRTAGGSLPSSAASSASARTSNWKPPPGHARGKALLALQLQKCVP